MAREMTGIYIPIVTPFNADESINFNGIKECTDFLVENGVSGVIPSGSTGEMIAMTPDEQIAVNRATVKAAGELRLFVQQQRIVLRMLICPLRRSRWCRRVMIVTPWYMAPNENELLKHYETVRKAIDIPIMLYHNPYYSTCLMTDEFMAKLYNEGFIDAVKERQADVYRQQNLRYLTNDGFAIFYGYDVSC